MSRPAPAAVLAATVLVLALAAPAQASRQTNCDPFGNAPCGMPFPNDMNLTVRDSSTPTGLRVRLPRAALPRNKDGVAANPAEWNRNDGFSLGALIVVRVPGLNTPAAARRSGLTPVTDLGRYDDRNASLVLIDAVTRRRQLAWAEVDVATSNRGQRMVMIHPAKNLEEGRRYIVALRNLRTASGKRIKASRSFRAIMRGRGPQRYRARYRGLFSTLQRAGVGKRNLFLAWDFTVSSQESIQGRMLHIRDDAFAQLGDTNLADGVVAGNAPQFTVDEVRDVPEDPRVGRRITGTFVVPCYLNQPGCPVGARFNYPSTDPDALPSQQPGNVLRARFDCDVPRAALTTPGRIMINGHGLLGNSLVVDRDNVRAMAEEHNFVTCATNWYGFSDEDIPQAIKVLQEGSNFPAFADRIQQGFLAQMYLGRLMLHPQGLQSNPAFPPMDLSELFYDGNSQGGILGAALAAMAPDYRRAVLGVPGINFSTLLYRSSNWDVYGAVYDPSYPDAGDRVLGLAGIQMLWDRAEPSGWAAHVTKDPPANTPVKTVLLQVAVGDWEVSTWQADALARTLGTVSARRPAMGDDRSLETEQLFGIPSIPSFPFAGSAIVYYDPGADFTGITPVGDIPPRGGQNSHYSPRQTPEARRQKSEFLRPNGSVVEVCTPGVPCPGAKIADS